MRKKSKISKVLSVFLSIVLFGGCFVPTVKVSAADSQVTAAGGPTQYSQNARIVSVSTVAQLNTAIANAAEGDIIELEDGNYSGSISKLTSKKNLTIRAKNVDKAVLVDAAKFDLDKCSYITIEGIKIISKVTTAIKLNSCNNVRITRCRISTIETPGADNRYILIQGSNSHHNRIDRNVFEEKHEKGQMLAIHGSSTQVSQYDVVELNHFKNFYPGNGNGFETIRVGLSGISMSSGYTIIQNNLFENTDGENECISLKACDLTVRYNTFLNVKGECTSRHGNRHSVYGNLFLADGVKEDTAGIRVFGQDHKYYNNVFSGLTGTAFVMNGGDVDTTGPLDEHWRQWRTEVSFNTIVNCANGISLGGKEFAPIDSKIANNIITGTEGTLIREVTSPISGESSVNTLWEGNIVYAAGSAIVGVSKSPGEVNVIDPQLTVVGQAYRLQSTGPAISAAVGTYTYVTEDMDGQLRLKRDAGADEYSNGVITHRPLTADDVGQNVKAVYPSAVSFDKKEGAPVGVMFRLETGVGRSLNSISNGTYPLAEGKDFTSVMESVYSAAYTLTNQYLTSLPVGEYILNFDFNTGKDEVMKLAVMDTTPPRLVVPQDIATEATGEFTPIDIGTAASDTGVVITNNAPAGFPIGKTVVTWTAVNKYGITSTAVQTINVVDTTPPEIRIAIPAATTYKTSETLTVNYTVTDIASGVNGTTAALDGEPVKNGDEINLATKAGAHVLEVTAQDKAGNSITKKVNFEVFIDATVDIKPETLNTKSHGGANSLTVYIEFPADYDVSMISAASVKMNINGIWITAETKPREVGDYNKNNLQDLMVKFDRQKAIQALGDTRGDVSISVAGALQDGRGFTGNGALTVIH